MILLRGRATSNLRLDSSTLLIISALGGVFKIDWICRKDLSFSKVIHLNNPWNDNKPVKIGRDGQEIEPRKAHSLLSFFHSAEFSDSGVAEEICRQFPEDGQVEMTPILRRSKESARQQRAKPESERRKAVPTTKPLSVNRGGPPRDSRGPPPMRKRRSGESLTCLTDDDLKKVEIVGGFQFE